jgi:hypothetical protein
MDRRNVIVGDASAGRVSSLMQLVNGLPEDLSAAVVSLSGETESETPFAPDHQSRQADYVQCDVHADAAGERGRRATGHCADGGERRASGRRRYRVEKRSPDVHLDRNSGVTYVLPLPSIAPAVRRLVALGASAGLGGGSPVAV